MKLKARLIGLIDELFGNEEALSKLHVLGFSDPKAFNEYIRLEATIFAKAKTLITAIGPQGTQWSQALLGASPQKRLGTLEAVKHAVEKDWLTTVENLVIAEAFDDLLEQAHHLLEKSYHVAAGTLGRAVLEEHVRKWCDRENCTPAKPKPTLL